MKSIIKVLGIIALIAVCGKNIAAAGIYDYSKVLIGDFSEFAGNWAAGGASFNLSADGTYGDFIRTSDVSKASGGYYTWSLLYKVPGDAGNYAIDRMMFLFPVGVDIIANGEIIQSDTTKVRILTGEYNPGISSVYYLRATVAKIAAAEAANAQAAMAEGYSKIINGDFSDFAGYWIDIETGGTLQLRADGTFSDGEAASAARRRDDGVYSWGIGDGEGGGGYAAALFPVGVDMWMGLPSDTTKVRMIRGQDFGPEYPIYYYSPER